MSIDVRQCEVEKAAKIACDAPHRSVTDLPTAPQGFHPGCGSHTAAEPEISKFGWGGARANSGGARKGAGRRRREVIHPEPINPNPGLRWYCVRTAFQQELVADIELRRAGFVVYLPAELRAAARTRSGEIRRGSYDRIVPLFPRYLFVQFDISDDHWRTIVKLRGVERIFGCTPEHPTPVPQRAIDILLEQCAPNGVIYPPKARQFDPLPIGAEVEILDGPFTAFHGICMLSAPKRVRLLVEIFGRSTEVELTHAQVREV